MTNTSERPLAFNQADQADPLAKTPRLIELLGVAGAGKSTLLRALQQHDERIRVLPLPNKLLYLPAIVELISVWLPLYLRKYRGTRWFSSNEIRLIGYLTAWLPHIRSQLLEYKDLVVVLDPGSIYWLSALREFGPEITKNARFQCWWENKRDEWSTSLDAVIWLEAPKELLLRRVLAREAHHEAKYQPSEIALEYFEKYGRSYEKIIAQMAERRRIQVFHYHTHQTSTQQMAREILSALNMQAPRGREIRADLAIL